jgi:hypothetical protein
MKNYNIIENNSVNQYGTASLVKSELTVENIRTDLEGRLIIFEIERYEIWEHLPSLWD